MNYDRIAHYVNMHDNQDYYVYYTETEAKKLSHGEVKGLLENFEIIFEYPIYEHLAFNFNTRKLRDFGEIIGTISYYRPKFTQKTQKS